VNHSGLPSVVDRFRIGLERLGLACRFIRATRRVGCVRATRRLGRGEKGADLWNEQCVGRPERLGLLAKAARVSSIRSSTVMMTMEKAQKIIEAGIVKAKQIGQPMNIAVVDAGANLTAFARMDGAWLGSIDIAINKAFTAKAFNISTLELGRNSQPKDQFFGIHVSNHARVMIFAGGIPIKMNGQIVGAVGVSGGSGEQDQAVAEAVVAASS
jgi:uncharacterized protein GlcG (DUF336 family)